MAAINPVVQIPVLDDDRVMTESAAITLYLAGMTGSDLLVPAVGAADWGEWVLGDRFTALGIYVAVMVH